MADDKPTQAPVEAAPDPDEDDLDELDDVLDDFAATKLDSKPKAPGLSGPGRPPKAAPGNEPVNEDDFAKQLQADMASLLGGLESNPDMAKELETMMKELGEAAAAEVEQADTSAGVAGPSPSKSGDANFQETIRKTMERMQESGEQAGAAAASASEDDFLAQMLKEMEKGMGGEGGEEDFSKMLMGMMEQLTNKDILYEPMKELHDKFPAWMEKNKDTIDKADLGRYMEQQTLATEITTKFEEKDYSDDNPAHRQYIVERMQKMQAAGSPPPDLVGDMNAAQEALGELDAGCPQQ